MSITKEAVDYVNPNIGTIGHLLTSTSPMVVLPHGMAQAEPVFNPKINDRYLSDKIYGFSFSGLILMAGIGKHYEKDLNHFASSFDHDMECVSPYFYSVLLEDYDIEFNYTVTQHAFLGRIKYPQSGDSDLMITFNGHKAIELMDSNSIRLKAKGDNVNLYFYIECSKPYRSCQMLEGQSAVFSYETEKDEYIDVKVGFSYIGCTQAEKNMRSEIDTRDFDDVKSKARDIWNKNLNKIEVSGGSEQQKTIFYTALYRSLIRMSDITEYGRYYSGFDGRIHEAKDHDFYVNDGIWDTYRCMHPLQIIIEPKVEEDMILSYVRMYEQSGHLARFPFAGGDRAVMIGNHTASFIADAFCKGITNIDIEKAYEAMKKNSTQFSHLPWCISPYTSLDEVYDEKGFFPALPRGEKEWVKEVHPFERRQAVAVTLEHSYDDWCIAQVALKLNKTDDYEFFMKRSQNYRNLYNASNGFMSPKTADGGWVADLDPKLDGGQGGRDYIAECNSWIYTYSVQHDINGLIELMGGKEKFEERLDALFTEQYDVPKYFFLQQFPDATGLIGQYCQGNEPAFHIPYLYNYAGAPWKTQRRVREIMRLWYNDGPLGICGDEDGGAMSSWYVFSSMGFYPEMPGKPVYDIGRTVIDEEKINLENGKTFVIKAENVSDRNKYIQSAYLNGNLYNNCVINHSDIINGGVLTLNMGDRPNKTWGI